VAWALLLISFLFIDVAASLPMGSLPLALAREGASSPIVSLVMGSAMFAALFGSVPVGWLADRIGRLPTMRYAVVLIVVSMALLSFAHGAAANGVVMALRSIAFVGLFTAEFAYAGEIVSEDRLVSSIATLGIIGNLAMALGPASAVWMWQHGVGRVQYAWADVAIVFGLLPLFFLPARHDVRSPRRSRTILMRSAWLPALAFCVAAQLQGGINGALAVLTFHHRGIANAALLFTAIATTVIVLRYPAGRCVDIYGPRIVAIPTAIFQSIGCVIAALAWHPFPVIVAGICLGVAWAAVIPIGVALFYEKSSRKTRGVAICARDADRIAGSGGGASLRRDVSTPGAAQIFVDVLLLKLTATPVLIGTATAIGRRWGPAVAGWFVGIPFTSAPVVFFTALTYGPQFASQVALGILLATISQVFYAIVFARIARRGSWQLAVAAATAVFAIFTVVLRPIVLPLAGAFAAVLVCNGLALSLMPKAAAETRASSITPPRWDLLLRMAIATALVVTLTEFAGVLGPHVTGLMSPYPIFATTLAVFAYKQRGGQAAAQFMRGLVAGLFAFATFFVVVAALLVPLGLGWSFAIALGAALLVQGIALWGLV
jgi:hypothetical protein